MANTFPWLFPGGEGDIWNSTRGKIPMKHWAKQCIRYYDGRFINDQLFTLYTYNKKVREINNSQGNFFFNSKNYFHHRAPTLEELKEQIRNGNDTFIRMLQHHSGQIRGSDGYWRQKGKELEQWINHHVSNGDGPPTFFITLSCAENWWPDLRRLMITLERKAKNEPQAKLLEDGDTTAMRKSVKRFSVYVNEFFIKRAKNFLENVLGPAFGIVHYWSRVEFAPGRGQIHLHILGISNDHAYLKEYHNAKTPEQKGNAVSSYMQRTFRYTADLKLYNDMKKGPDPNTSPLKKRFSEVPDSEEIDDGIILAEDCMCHICNDYCLKSKSKTAPRECNKGFGKETERGKGDTPGMPQISTSILHVDTKGVKHLHMKRSHSKRLVQHSIDLLRIWRANIDVKCLLFDTNPKFPNMREIDAIICYIAGYTVKKNKTLKEENQMIQDLIYW